MALGRDNLFWVTNSNDWMLRVGVNGVAHGRHQGGLAVWEELQPEREKIVAEGSDGSEEVVYRHLAVENAVRRVVIYEDVPVHRTDGDVQWQRQEQGRQRKRCCKQSER